MAFENKEKDIYWIADVVVACHCKFSMCGSSEITREVIADVSSSSSSFFFSLYFPYSFFSCFFFSLTGERPN